MSRIKGIKILLQILDTFAHSLIYAHLFIELEKNTNSGTPISITIPESIVSFWLAKNIIVLSFCINGCEDFYTTIKEAERSCLMLLGNNKGSGLKRLYKNVIRINRAKFNKMTACGVLTIDAALPLSQKKATQPPPQPIVIEASTYTPGPNAVLMRDIPKKFIRTRTIK
ncbi:jg13851 [Pararge aegeria aegeria]|uniref:Jg13851 protein n=1 Tax=Pararge aegeria aegeria TaxID=348720 RepID=A0A8S4S4I8_9NEOP|nr:jg13851 [Pararge aegeria aegeria]